MLQLVLIILILIGIIIVIISILKDIIKCNNNKIVYNYIPQTYEDEKNSLMYTDDIYKVLYSRPSNWIESINNYEIKEYNNIINFMKTYNI